MIRSAAAAATQGSAAEAAQAILTEGGGAVDAVIAGFFGAAGARPDVLFAPAVALVTGFGAGSRVFDGRAAQPGRGATRPRGFVSEREIPPAARVAVPRSIAMLMLLASYQSKMSLSELSSFGVTSAEAAGAKARAKVVRRVGAAGVLAIRGELLEPILAVGGPMAGGALSAVDLEEMSPSQTEARIVSKGGSVFTTLPADFEHLEEDPRGERRIPNSEVILACDGRGTLAVLAYAPFGDDAVAIPGLEISIGGDALPVRRGVTRLPPGTVLRAPMRLGVATHAGSTVAIGLSGRGQAMTAEDMAWLADGAPFEAALEEIRARLGSPCAAGVLTNGKSARLSMAKGSS